MLIMSVYKIRPKVKERYIYWIGITIPVLFGLL